jgi:hypothetical protein
MITILRQARSARKTLHPWFNPGLISQQILGILSEYSSGFKVETDTQSSTYSSLLVKQARKTVMLHIKSSNVALFVANLQLLLPHLTPTTAPAPHLPALCIIH